MAPLDVGDDVSPVWLNEVESPTERQQILGQIESMRAIEQAKGLLMGRYAIDADAAFALLCRWSNNHNIKVRAISDLLVASVCAQAATDPPPRAEPLQAVIDRLNDPPIAVVSPVDSRRRPDVSGEQIVVPKDEGV